MSQNENWVDRSVKVSDAPQMNGAPGFSGERCMSLSDRDENAPSNRLLTWALSAVLSLDAHYSPFSSEKSSPVAFLPLSKVHNSVKNRDLSHTKRGKDYTL